MMLKQRVKEIAPVTNQGRSFLKVSGALVAFAAGCHLIMGAGFVTVLFCSAATLLSLLPMAYFGPFNIAALLVGLVGFRYVGFPLFAKLAMGQALDTIFGIQPVLSVWFWWVFWVIALRFSYLQGCRWAARCLRRFPARWHWAAFRL